jgi:hypothetical protein
MKQKDPETMIFLRSTVDKRRKNRITMMIKKISALFSCLQKVRHTLTKSCSTEPCEMMYWNAA